MAETIAPTITIDGVTSNPGEPTSFVSLACDCVKIFPGHGFVVGGVAGCGTCGIETTITAKLETWVF